MGEYFLKSLIVPIVYMFLYVLKGKRNGFLGFIEALMNSVALYFAAIIPVIFVSASIENIGEFSIENVVLFFITIIFSAPFFSGLMKSVNNDFEIKISFENKRIIYNLYVYIIVMMAALFATLLCLYSFFSDPWNSWDLLFAGICFWLGSLMTIKKLLQRFFEYQLKISDKFIVIGTITCIAIGIILALF